MTKQLLSMIAMSAYGLLFLASASAHQAPAATNSKPAAQSGASSAAKSATTPKTGQTAGAKRPVTAPAPLKTQKEKASYAIGMNLGKSFKKDEVDLDPASLARGLKDAMAGNKPLLTDDEAKAALTALTTAVRAKQQAKLDAISAANKKEGDDFLAANKAKDGVVALPSGLQYKILKEGTGPKPTTGDKVTCNYSGTLIEGKEFDSSYKRGQPVTFGVGEVIKGWSEALQLMPVGSKWQLFVPPDLAYGERGAGQEIGPNSTLIFEVELISIAPKTEVKPDAKSDAKPDSQ